MTKKEKIASFDPSGVGLKNGNFIGLPFDENDAEVVLMPVPWDVTVSFAAGTSTGADNILESSSQLDLYDHDVKNAWKMGLFMRPLDQKWLEKSEAMRSLSAPYIDFLENGGDVSQNPAMKKTLDDVNASCEELRQWVYEESKNLLEKGKLVGLVGGDHSTPLGYIQALAERYENFGILHFDAHLDLRNSYEGFTYSHASIFYNVLKLPQITRMVSVGIRDYCEEEVDLVENSGGRVQVFFDSYLKKQVFKGNPLYSIYQNAIDMLPKNVYVSFDIDVLTPHLCPNTGTPVPGGLEFQEAMFFIKCLLDSGRKIIGFDLSETAAKGHDWDGNVAARVLYKLANVMGKSQGRI
jgi:agmatinase